MTLKYGSKGLQVTWVQNVLNKDGFNLTVDGDFGNGTKNAVLEFQRRYKLHADALIGVGGQTWKKLEDVAKRRFDRKYYDKQTTYFVYPKSQVEKIDMINSKGANQWSVENVVSMYNRSDVDTLSNGGMYDMVSGATCHYFVDEGVQIGYNAYDPYAVLVMYDGTIKFADVSKKVSGVKDGMGFSPSLFVDGVAKSWNKNVSKAYLIGYAPRHAFMETKNYYVEVFVNGRNPAKFWFGCSIPKLTEICKTIGNKLDAINGGVKNGGNLDGGDSVSMAVDSVEVIQNKPTMRKVDNGLGIKMKP